MTCEHGCQMKTAGKAKECECWFQECVNCSNFEELQECEDCYEERLMREDEEEYGV